MAMKTPVHPGRIVKMDCLEPLHLTVTRAAEILGVTRQALNNLVNEKAGISPEMAIRLEKASWGPANTWLQMQVNYDLARVRVKEADIQVEQNAPELVHI